MKITTTLVVLASFSECADSVGDAPSNLIIYSSPPDSQSIRQDIDGFNVEILNGTTLTLDGYSIVAPANNIAGDDAVRVQDATFIAKRGVIKGGLGVGGSGVTVTSTRDSREGGTAVFEEGVVVYGGDATRNETTQGGDAITILNEDSTVLINGGSFFAGLGCTNLSCGAQTADGVAIQNLAGRVVIKGGTFEGIIYNSLGTVEVHGCFLTFDDGKIEGTLLDGNGIDIEYVQPKGQDEPPLLITDMCPDKQETEDQSRGKILRSTLSAFVSALFLSIM
ncbi:hypothetical protein THAOC_10039 [Thalassiosira oceanica]|uniref:LTD domain-containing protein n=1 Tax=Thalassiosira oceanica TaxID=159749 RepID=K0SR87_THAOC|nr:hypothetical protein THAOC_10039 [Thalassiosira oceanica]|eukprot:EJK68753.1 hypothetical protein THAOC_10039 [Thalassiosira oceanica]